MNDSFFMSDSLKDVIDEQMLSDESFGTQVTNFDSAMLPADFVSFSLVENTMTVEVTQKIAKVLLSNPRNQFSFSFMEEMWFLSSERMKLRQEKEGKYHATLQIIDRRKEDTYERTV